MTIIITVVSTAAAVWCFAPMLLFVAFWFIGGDTQPNPTPTPNPTSSPTAHATPT